MRECMQAVFPNIKTLAVDTDIVGAARALMSGHEGIVCILGTGANSCLWDGERIVRQTPALGYILGDEGSGAVLGRMLINALYKGGLPESIKKVLNLKRPIFYFIMKNFLFHNIIFASPLIDFSKPSF